MTSAATDTAVRSFVHRLTGWSALPGNSNRRRPADAFATVLLVSSRAEGAPFHMMDGGDRKTFASSSLDYSVQFHGAEATEAAQLFADRADSGNYDLADGLAYQGTSDVLRLDEILSDEFRERAVVNFRVQRTREVTIDVDDVEAASIRLNINGEEAVIE